MENAANNLRLHETNCQGAEPFAWGEYESMAFDIGRFSQVAPALKVVCRANWPEANLLGRGDLVCVANRAEGKGFRRAWVATSHLPVRDHLRPRRRSADHNPIPVIRPEQPRLSKDNEENEHESEQQRPVLVHRPHHTLPMGVFTIDHSKMLIYGPA